MHANFRIPTQAASSVIVRSMLLRPLSFVHGPSHWEETYEKPHSHLLIFLINATRADRTRMMGRRGRGGEGGRGGEEREGEEGREGTEGVGSRIAPLAAG